MGVSNDLLISRQFIQSRAIYYLSKRDYSRNELAKKLLQYVLNKDILLQSLNTSLKDRDTIKHGYIACINTVLNDLHTQNILNDTRFISNFIRKKAPKYGTSVILDRISAHQTDDNLNANTIQLLKDSELQRCYYVWLKRFHRYNSVDLQPLSYSEKQTLLAKQARFLAQRGFDYEVIHKILNGWTPEIENLKTTVD